MISTVVAGLFFLANVCFCLAYLVRDIFWLRALTIVAALMTFPYFIFQSEVLWLALFWQAMFALINLMNLAHLYLARRPVPMTDQQQHLKNLVFRNFTARETKALIDCGSWHEGRQGDVLIRQGQQLDSLYLLYSGDVQIICDGEIVSYRGPGSFLGELHYVTGAATAADVRFSTEARYIQWEVARLKALLLKKPALNAGFESLLALTMANKLAAPANVTAALGRA